ncbi:double-strand-break repair RAD21-like protein [Vairimorpha necatrix]|uniref:Double-strand-break repair RAD21-like protein n=1 Tax=Vairimorpha necatrix TaxID=6039 RepID=A0AAX4JF69_9MICR
MFYAKDLLSMQTKSDISLIYYLSTTGFSRRISKKDIIRLNIKDTLVTVLDQSFALRLYGFILKGVSKVYILKITYFENEVTDLLNLLRVRVLKKTVKPKLSVSSDDGDIYDGGLCSEIINDTEYNMMEDFNCIKNNISCIKNTNCINTDLYLSSDFNCIKTEYKVRNNKIVDEKIEDSSEYSRNIKRHKPLYKFINIKEYPVFRLMNKKEYKDSLEVYRNKSSSNYPSQILSESKMFSSRFLNFSSKFDSNISLDEDFNIKQASCYSSEYKVQLLDLLRPGKYFSEVVSGTRKTKALMFYELLNLLSQDLVECSQENEDILISRVSY